MSYYRLERLRAIQERLLEKSLNSFSRSAGSGVVAGGLAVKAFGEVRGGNRLWGGVLAAASFLALCESAVQFTEGEEALVRCTGRATDAGYESARLFIQHDLSAS